MSRPRWPTPSVVPALAALALGACAHSQAPPEPNNGNLTRLLDPYTGKPTLALEYVLAPVPVPEIDRDADERSTILKLAFVRDPSAGDVVLLRARQECWYNLKGKRVECLATGCGIRPHAVEAYGRLDGSPAQLPRFECKGWGRAAVEYSASFTRPAVQTIASGSEFWIRVPTGEIRMNAAQIASLRSFMEEVDRTPAHVGPESVDLRK